MRIQHNIAAMNSYRNFTVNNSKMAKNLEKLSSGYRVNRAGDDAAGLAVSEKMRAQITGLEAAQKNANDGIGLIQTAEGALSEVHDMLNRAVYLIEQGANGTYTSTDRSNLGLELNQLGAEIDRIASSANFNRQSLFGAEAVQIVVDDDNQQITVDCAKDLAGTAGSSAISSSLIVKNDGSGVATVRDIINTISSWRAELGAKQNRLEHTVKNLGVMRENISNAESQIRDTDVAEEMTAFTKNSIMNQAAQAMVAQANQLPQGVLQLLQ